MRSLALLMFLGVNLLAGAPAGKTAHPLKLVEELRFGYDDEHDHLLWSSQLTSVSVSSNGHMFVADPTANAIYEFDADGTYVRQVAKQGEGPGEFEYLHSFTILPDDRAIAFEVAPGTQPTLSFFDESMKFVKTHQVADARKIPTTAVFAPDGKRFASTWISIDFERGKMITHYGLLDLDYAVIDELGNFEQDFNPQRFGEPEFLAAFLADFLSGTIQGIGMAGFDKHGNVYTAEGRDYRVTKRTPDLEKEIGVFARKDYRPRPMSDEHVAAIVDQAAAQFANTPMADMMTPSFMERIKDKADVPPVKAPVLGILVTANDRLLVVHDNAMDTGNQLADIFDPDGTHRGQIEVEKYAFLSPSLSLPRMLFTETHAYTVETNEHGDNEVVRYKLDWQ